MGLKQARDNSMPEGRMVDIGVPCDINKIQLAYAKFLTSSAVIGRKPFASDNALSSILVLENNYMLLFNCVISLSVRGL